MSYETSTPDSARAHARAQVDSPEALRVRTRPVLPVTEATDLPSHVSVRDLVWDETLGAGGYSSRVLERGTRVRIESLEGDACVALLAYNADHPAERLNVADTVKVQWQAYLAEGALLLSDMGRVLLSIVRDTCGRHDAFCGASNARVNAEKYGDGSVSGPTPPSRDCLLLAAAKHGLGKRDLGPNVNLFKGVRIAQDGSLSFDEASGRHGESVELRAEMRVLLVLANAPHVLDPRSSYEASPARVLAWRGPLTPEDDPLRRSTPERLRAFQNVEDYYNR